MRTICLCDPCRGKGVLCLHNSDGYYDAICPDCGGAGEFSYDFKKRVWVPLFSKGFPLSDSLGNSLYETDCLTCAGSLSPCDCSVCGGCGKVVWRARIGYGPLSRLEGDAVCISTLYYKESPKLEREGSDSWRSLLHL